MKSVLLKTDSDLRRFWSKVERRENGCWPWLGYSRPNDGMRGVFSIGYKAVSAPRVAWAVHHGREPEFCICHTCDNPNSVNPAHLWDGTVEENVRDAVEKGRWFKSHCKNGHEYTPENTRIRSDGHRQCRTCKTEGNRRLVKRRSLDRRAARHFGREGYGA